VKKIILSLSISVATLTGTHAFAASDSLKDGWIKKIVLGSELKEKSVRECVARMPPQQVDAQRFVVVAYPKGRGWAYKTLPVSEQSELKAGDKVSFDLADCVAPQRRP
jgi:hypothetical protein